MYDIIIIGAGPAGLTAGIYAKRASKKVLILEALSYGGQIINTPLIEVARIRNQYGWCRVLQSRPSGGYKWKLIFSR